MNHFCPLNKTGTSELGRANIIFQSSRPPVPTAMHHKIAQVGVSSNWRLQNEHSCLCVYLHIIALRPNYLHSVWRMFIALPGAFDELARELTKDVTACITVTEFRDSLL